MTNPESHPFLPDHHSTCVQPLSDGRVCGGVSGQEIHTHEEIPSIAMYGRELYAAVEAYASNRTDRHKYDAVIEAATAQANRYLKHRAEIDRLQRVEGK